jgi:hypothetical protein
MQMRRRRISDEDEDDDKAYLSIDRWTLDEMSFVVELKD